MTTIAQHGEIAQTIARHDVIHKQLQNMVKFTNNRTTWWNSQIITQHGEIHKLLHNISEQQILGE